MRIDDKNRPEEITCDEIWELYKLLEGLDEHYVFYDRCNAPGEHEELFYLEKTTIGENGVCYYGPDSMGFELPCSKDEWVELLLKHIENGRIRQYVCRITVNALFKNKKSVQELLEEKHIRIATVEELSAAEYEDHSSGYDDSEIKLPVIHTPVPIRTEFARKHEEAETVAYWFLKYLRYHFVPYKEDKDGGVLRYTFVFMSENSPGGFVEGCVWFYDKAAEVRLYYNQIGADLCKGSEHRPELLRLLNFINARVFMEIRDGAGNRFYDPQILHTPRIYLTEDDGYDISITTTINYKFWKNARLETHDYITAYCPELLDKLSPFIFGALKGEMSVSEAILGIETRILK